jgi:hypothetical protein
MKTTQWTRTITMSALALALCLGATTLSAQPDQRGQRGGPRDNPGAAAPVRPGPGAAPAERGPGGERGPMDRRLQREFAPPQASPVAGLLADVNPFWDRPQVVERMALTEEQVAALKTSYEKQRPTIEANNTRMREAGQKVSELLNAEGEADIDALRKAVTEFTSAQSAAMLAAVDHRAVVQKTLNAEQLDQMRGMRARFRAPGMDRPAPGMPDAPGARRDLPELPDRGNMAPPRREPAPQEGMTREERLQQQENNINDIIQERRQRVTE